MDIITGLLSLFGGAGGIFGIVKFLIGVRRQSAMDNAEMDHKKDLAYKQQLVDYQKALNESKGEVFVYPIKRKILWGLWSYEGDKVKTVRTDTANHDRSSIMHYIVICYCACCLLCFIDGDISVATLNPNEVPNTTSWLYGLYTKSKVEGEVYVLSLVSVGLLLLNPLSFAICQWITGAGLNQLRRR
jgi:hypothetical protein